jgi:hypothetical protein
MSRKDVRETLAATLEANVPSAQAVYSYQVTSFGGQSPVLAVTSSGTQRDPLTMRGSQPTYRYDIHVFVLHSDKASSWTEQDAENLLDQLEAEIGAVVDAYRRATAWQRLTYAEASDARSTPVIEGQRYLHEVIPVEVLANL